MIFKRPFFFAGLFFASALFSFSQEFNASWSGTVFNEAVLESEKSVESLSLSDSASHFSYTDGEKIFIAPTMFSGSTIFQRLSVPNLAGAFFFHPDSSSNDLNPLFAFSTDGTVRIWNSVSKRHSFPVEIEEPDSTFALNGVSGIKKVAYSADGMNFAVLDQNDEFTLFCYLRYTRQIVGRRLSGSAMGKSEISSMAYSESGGKSSEFFLCAYASGAAEIFSLETYSLVASFSTFDKNAFRPIFSPIGNQVVYSKNRKNLCVADFKKKTERDIEIKEGVRTANFFRYHGEFFLAVVDSKSRTLIFDANTLEYVETVMPYEKSGLTCAKFFEAADWNGKYSLFMLQAFENKKIHRVSLSFEKNSQPKKEKPKIGSSSVGGSPSGGGGNSDSPSGNSWMNFLVAASWAESPFSLAAKTGFEYNKKVISPHFFTGAGLDALCLLPESKFPYTYKVDGRTMDSPRIVGFTLYAPFGAVFPLFSENLSVDLGIRAGCRFLWMVGLYSGEMASSGLFLSPSGGAFVRFRFRNLTAGFVVDCDRILGIEPRMELGCRLIF